MSTAFALPLRALVVDSSMNPLAGVTVVFSAPGSGASAALSAATATTDGQGIASVTATANATPGAYQITAGISGTTAATTFSADERRRARVNHGRQRQRPVGHRRDGVREPARGRGA